MKVDFLRMEEERFARKYFEEYREWESALWCCELYRQVLTDGQLGLLNQRCDRAKPGGRDRERLYVDEMKSNYLRVTHRGARELLVPRLEQCGVCVDELRESFVVVEEYSTAELELLEGVAKQGSWKYWNGFIRSWDARVNGTPLAGRRRLVLPGEGSSPLSSLAATTTNEIVRYEQPPPVSYSSGRKGFLSSSMGRISLLTPNFY